MMKTIDRCLTFTSAALALSLAVSAAPASPAPGRPYDLVQRPYTVDQEGLSFTPLPGAKAYTGVTKNGAGWRMEVPANWNGGLLIYARGGAQHPAQLCDPIKHTNCVLPDAGFPEIRSHVLERGFGWVSTTFREFRMTPRARALDSVEVAAAARKVRSDKLGRTYIMGESLGGLTVQTALEMLPGSFDGGIAGCISDASGGPSDFAEFILVAMALVAPQSPEISDFLRQARLPAEWETLQRLAPKALALLGPDFPYERSAAGDALLKVMENRSGGSRPMFFAGFFADGADLVSAEYLIQTSAFDAGTRSFLDNHSVDYRWLTRPGEPSSPQEAALNRTIPRFNCDPSVCSSEPSRLGQTRNLGGFYMVTGRITVPLIQINTLGDMKAFYAGARRYYSNVHAVGAGQLIAHRAIRDKRHCGFNVAELSEAFDDLDDWVRTAQKPIEDNPTDLAAVAAPDYGCRFTRGSHDQDWTYNTACKSFAPRKRPSPIAR